MDEEGDGERKIYGEMGRGGGEEGTVRGEEKEMVRI